MARKSTCCSPSTPGPPGHPQHSQGCELSRPGCGSGPGQCRKEVFTLGLPCCTPAPLCCTPAPRLPSLGCPRPTGSPAAFPCPRPHFLRGMVSLFNLSCPLPNTPPSYLPPDGAAKGALAGRAPFNTRGADSGVAGGGGRGRDPLKCPYLPRPRLSKDRGPEGQGGASKAPGRAGCCSGLQGLKMAGFGKAPHPPTRGQRPAPPWP